MLLVISCWVLAMISALSWERRYTAACVTATLLSFLLVQGLSLATWTGWVQVAALGVTPWLLAAQRTRDETQRGQLHASETDQLARLGEAARSLLSLQTSNQQMEAQITDISDLYHVTKATVRTLHLPELFEASLDIAPRLIDAKTLRLIDLSESTPHVLRASRAGVGRVHLIGYDEDGTLLRELFSRDGVGTIITRESLEKLRDARPDDISGLVALIEPLEEEGVLVRRSRELLEREITRFSVVEHDGLIVGCAALYPHGEDQAELACMAVHPHYRRWGYGEQLMKRIETRARAAGIKRLFVLTTVTSHWFKERGFAERPIAELPAEKRQMYNLQRRSKVLMKTV